jgi:hypothetical protein
MLDKIAKLGLTAPDAFWVTDEATLLLMAGGCGPGGVGDWLVPDSIWGLNIKPACFIHDYMYAVGETEEDKRWADQVFLSNMLQMVDSETTKIPFIGVILRAKRRSLAMLYYTAVVEGGGRHFEKAKI